MREKEFKEFRCFGKNRNGRICNALLFKYKIKKDEMVIQTKCGSCNSYSILRLPFEKNENDNKQSQ